MRYAGASVRLRRNAYSELTVGPLAIGPAASDFSVMRPPLAPSVLPVLRFLPTCPSGSFSDHAGGAAPWPGQPRNGSGSARPPFRRLGRCAEPPAGTRCEIRFSICQRFALEHQERAERTLC